MAAADWEEIKRLAADFQRAQLSSTVQRLSERNCVEIVQRLQQLSLIDVLYTTDGKEYLTPQELSKEILEELQVHGGRVNLVDLQQALNIDLRHVEVKVADLIKTDHSLQLILGQLIDQTYLDSLAEEINDKLQEQGQVSVAELTKAYDLPGDFVSQTIQERLGSIIHGQRDDYDPDVIFTEAFVERHQAKIRGAFSAVTRPIAVMNVMNQYRLQERMFHRLLEELVTAGRLAGNISGGRQDVAQYIPDIYTRSQHSWVDSFYQQNGYLEYDAVERLGISDPKAFIRKRFKGQPLQYLSSCCIGREMEERVEAEIDEALATGGWVDVALLLPSICTRGDVAQLLTKMVKTRPGVQVFSQVILSTEQFVSACSAPFTSLINTKAEMVARTNPGLLSADGDKRGSHRQAVQDDGREDKKENRRKKASAGKSGGGTQGREVRTKSTKKKYHRGGHEDSDEEESAPSGSHGNRPSELEFLTVEEIETELRKLSGLSECPDDFVTEIAEQLHRPLSRQFTQAAKSIFLQTVGTGSGAARKKTHGELSEKIQGLWTNIKLFEKGVSLFPEETQGLLCKHLLKTVCSDVTNLVFSAVATDNMLSVGEQDQLTVDARTKLLAKMPEDKAKVILTKLHTSLNGKSLEDFFHQLDAICSTAFLEISLKKPDKKKERQLVFNHRQALGEQLRGEPDPAMALHLAAVLVLLINTQCMVHVPGKCVPQIIALLRTHMEPDAHQVLVQCQDVVVRKLKLQHIDEGGDHGDEDALTAELEELLPKVKDIGLTAKKSSASAAAQPQTPDE